jgi:hypothetical protein
MKLKIKQQDRLYRLMPSGVPRYVRCYDNGGETADRYTVVYTGRYRGRGGCFYLGMNAAPFHPQGIGQHGESDRPIDRPSYGHLGKRIAFEELPPDCQKAVLQDYRELWDLPSTVNSSTLA